LVYSKKLIFGAVTSKPMNRFLPRLWPLAILILAGCGDTYTDLVKEETALANEFADSLLKVVDEKSAANVKDYYLGKIKDKVKYLKDRKDRFNKTNKTQGLESLQMEIASDAEVGKQKDIKIGEIFVKYRRKNKDEVEIEIECETKSLYRDLKMIANPDTQKHLDSVKRRVDRQVARITGLYAKLVADRPDVEPSSEWPVLSTYNTVIQDVFPEFPALPKLPVQYDKFSSVVKLKPSSAETVIFVAQLLSLPLSLVQLACFIFVLVQMFQRGQSTLGIVCLVLIFCGGGLIAFVVGWQKAEAWDIGKIMVAWTFCFVIQLTMSALIFFMFIL